MCSEFEGFPKLYSELNISQHRANVTDFTVPSFEAIRDGVLWLMNHIKGNGTRVYIHCKAGRGRSATLVLCYLVYRYDLSLEEAQSLISKRRPQVDTFLAKSAPAQQFWQWISSHENHHRIPFPRPL